MIKKITVIGGSSTGHAAAAVYSDRGFEVTLYDSTAYETALMKVRELGSIQMRGKVRMIAPIAHVTTDPAEAVKDAELIAVHVMSSRHEEVARAIAPYVQDGQHILIVPGNLGAFVFRKVFDEMGVTAKVTLTEQEGNLMTPYADDLSACIALLMTMEQLKDETPVNDLYFVFTVQEEVGLRGAKAAAWEVNPDLGIAVDVTRTGDTPADLKGQRMQVALGKGPTVKRKDSSVQCNPQVVELLEKAAKAAKIPFQTEVLLAGGTDTAAVQKSRSGVLSGCVSIPCRNIHAPAEIVSIKDVENVSRLLAAVAQTEIEL